MRLFWPVILSLPFPGSFLSGFTPSSLLRAEDGGLMRARELSQGAWSAGFEGSPSPGRFLGCQSFREQTVAGSLDSNTGNLTGILGTAHHVVSAKRCGGVRRWVAVSG